jgi:hypothetical protein
MDKHNCENCKYWQVTTKCKDKGKCRRHAPKLIVAGCGVGELPEYKRDWAETLKIELCGEWEAKTAEKVKE